MTHQIGDTCLENILITEELSRRTPRTPNLKAENDALRTLARQLVEQPQTIFKTLVAIAKDLCQAGTAGLSLLELTPGGEELVRWVALSGELEQYEQGTTLRHFSPCGTCLERQAPQLYSYPAQYFTYLQQITPPITEGLVIPLTVASQPLGTIWVVSHGPQRQFDAEDVRMLTSLADFTAAALYNNQTRQAAESAQSLLHMLLEHVPEGITIAGSPPDFPLIANSKLAQEWLGKPDESLTGMSSGCHVQSYGLFLPDGVTRHAPEQLPLYRATRYGETIRDEEYIIERPDGTRIIVNNNVVPVRDAQGEIIAAINCWRDITERKRIEEALRQREAELRLVTDTVPVLISFVDAERRYRFNNRTYEEWFGHPATEVYGKTLWEVLGEAAYQTIRPYVDQVFAGQQVTFESEVPYQEGGIRYISATYIPRFGSQGVEGFVALVSDISAQKRTELALRKSEERLRIAQQAARAGVWNWDIVTNQVTWSAEYYDLYGLDYATTQSSYENWLASVCEQDRDRADRAARDALEHQIDLNVEFRVLHPIQGERWITAIGQTFYDANRKPVRMTGIALDITDRKQAEEALRQSESRFQTMVKNMPGMIYRYVPGSKGRDAFTYVSPGSRDLFELEPETILQDAKVLWSLVHPDDFVALKESIAIAVEQGLPWQWEGRIITPSGQLKWIRGESRMENAQCEVVWDGLLIDISDRKRIAAEREQLLERERAARSEAESANRVKDEFLAVLSHELRSPLNPILGWAKLLQSRKLNEAKTLEALATIERNAKLQAELIEDLLDVSRILRGKLSLNMVGVDLVATSRAAMETVRLAAEAKSIQIQTKFDLSVGKVLGDAARIQQVIWNLLSNAVKFTPVGGQVEVRLEQVRGGSRELGVGREVDMYFPSFAQITVSDTGKGIAPDFLPYVFDYFRQADSATTRKFGGLGLGLAIVRHLVELHGGTIQADSQGEGMGATFTLRLPLLENWESRAGTWESKTDLPLLNAHPLAGLRILVVDDDTDTREFIAFWLEQNGASVTAVASAREGLAALSESPLDVLLSDIGMPDIDGYMFLQQVRTLPPAQGGNIPAIALTAYAGEINQQKALAAGFQNHLAKPIEPSEILEAIAALVKP